MVIWLKFLNCAATIGPNRISPVRPSYVASTPAARRTRRPWISGAISTLKPSARATGTSGRNKSPPVRSTGRGIATGVPLTMTIQSAVWPLANAAAAKIAAATAISMRVRNTVIVSIIT